VVAAFQRNVGGQIDIGAFEVQTPPRVTGVVINGGATQRSRVTALQVIFNRRIALPALSATAFHLERQSDNAAVDLSTAVDNSGPTTTVTLSFSGGLVDFGSLADGRYTLSVSAALVLDPSLQPLDGNGDGTAGDNYTFVGSPTNGLFRLFGDADGNGIVDQTDFIAFRLAFNNGPSNIFDFNGDGHTDQVDIIQFRNRFNIVV